MWRRGWTQRVQPCRGYGESHATQRRGDNEATFVQHRKTRHPTNNRLCHSLEGMPTMERRARQTLHGFQHKCHYPTNDGSVRRCHVACDKHTAKPAQSSAHLSVDLQCHEHLGIDGQGLSATRDMVLHRSMLSDKISKITDLGGRGGLFPPGHPSEKVIRKGGGRSPPLF